MTRARAAGLAAAGLGLVLVLVALVVGPGGVTFGDALAVLLGGERSPMIHTLVLDVRLPRALLVAAIGAALSASGVITQGLFRNPLAEPGVLGVSVGAATAAVVGFAWGLDAFGMWMTSLLAAGGALGVLAFLLLLVRGKAGVGALLLSGIAIGALCSAVTTLVLSLGTERWDLGVKVVRWLMGSFEGRSWDHFAVAGGALIIGLAMAAWVRVDLDALALGEQTAASLGVDLQRTQWISLGAVAILVGTATALCGVIGFVGLVIPHLARAWVGPAHRGLLLSASALGAVLLLAVDTASRGFSILSLPPGAITSLIGAPFFLWVLRGLDKEDGET